MFAPATARGPGANKYGTLRQQNTFTGKLAPAMLRGVLEQAKDLAGIG